MARLEIRLLGGFEVIRDGAPVVDFEANTARALLAYLGCESGRGSSRATLAEMLWPDRRQGVALSNLRHTLAVLRRTLGVSGSERSLLLADRTPSLSETPPTSGWTWWSSNGWRRHHLMRREESRTGNGRPTCGVVRF